MSGVRSLSAALVAFALTGCDQTFESPSTRNMELAEKKIAQQEYAEAVRLYEGALDGTPKTAEIHYKLGLIYDEQMKAPISAIHHFQRYLEFLPNGPRSSAAKKYLQEDLLKLTASLGNGATVSQEEARRIKNTNLDLQKKINELKEQLEVANKARAEALKALGTKGGGVSAQIQKPLVPGIRTYTVEQGDTLATIARKFYNNKEQWKKIQDANFEPMEGAAKIKPGMVLMVP